MAFVATDLNKVYESVFGDQRVVVFEVTGDGSETDIPISLMGMVRANFSSVYPQGVTTNLRYLATIAGATLAFDAAPDSTDVYTVIAYGY